MLALTTIFSGPALAQSSATPSTPTPFDPATLPDQEIGRKFMVKAEDLPSSRTGPLVASRSLVVPYNDQRPRVPDGFTATPFATGLEHPRRLLVLPNGDVIVAEQSKGHLTLLRDDDGDGRADWIQRHAEGFNGPYGLAWRDGYVLVAGQDGIWQVPHRLGALRPGAGAQNIRAADVSPEERKPTSSVVAERMLTKKGVFGIVQGHANRHLAIDPKTGALFVGVGSSGNIGVEPEVKASIQRFDANGSNQTTFASGLRNPTTLASNPSTGDLYTLYRSVTGLATVSFPTL
jgi:glucose/arabinose dehydrogenase